jgi:long-subunit fatty acid transport protein
MNRIGPTVGAIALSLAATSAWAQGAAPGPRGLDIRDSVRLGIIPGSGARALGMGGAFVAVADDGTAASWNPAGLAVLERPEGSAVWRFRDAQTLTNAPLDFEADFRGERFTRKDGVQIENGTASPFDFASFAYPVRVGRWKLVPQVSYQRGLERGYSRTTTDQTSFSQDLFAPGELFGSGGAIETTSVKSFQTDARGGVDLWSVGIGASPSEKIAFGLVVNRWLGSDIVQEATSGLRSTACGHDFDPNAPALPCVKSTQSADELTEERESGWNVNVGVLWHPAAKWRVGGVYKSAFTLDRTTNSSASVRDHTDAVLDVAALDNESILTSVQTGTIRWPWTAAVGVAFMPRPELTLSLDATTSHWSDAQADFTTTLFSSDAAYVDSEGRPIGHEITGTERNLFPSGLPVPADRATAAPPDQIRRQPDAHQLRGGVEYVVRQRRFVVPLRAGAFVDRLPVTDGSGHDIRTLGLTAGIGFVWSSLSLDLAYVHRRTEYSLAYTLTPDLLTCVPEFCETKEQVTTLRDDRFTSSTLYVSTIFRLP